jgi:hypothetical protein
MNVIKSIKVVTAIVASAAISACTMVPAPIDVAQTSQLVPYSHVDTNVIKT